MVLGVNSDYSLNSTNWLTFVVKGCVLFDVRTEFLNIIYTSFGLKGFIKHRAIKACVEWRYSSTHP
jgi:hypothetical protein